MIYLRHLHAVKFYWWEWCFALQENNTMRFVWNNSVWLCTLLVYFILERFLAACHIQSVFTFISKSGKPCDQILHHNKLLRKQIARVSHPAVPRNRELAPSFENEKFYLTSVLFSFSSKNNVNLCSSLNVSVMNF